MSTERGSRPRRAWLGPTCVLLLLAVAAWIYANVPDADSSGSDVRPAPERATAPAGTKQEATSPRSAPTGSLALTGLEAPPRTQGPPRDSRWWLHVRLIGLAPEDRERVRVSAGHAARGTRLHPAVEVQGVGPDDLARLEITSIIGTGVVHPRWLEVDAEGALPLRRGMAALHAADTSEAQGGTIEMEVELTRCCLLTGRIVLSDGTPAVGAKVGLAREPSTPPGESVWQEEATCGSDGGFRLRCVALPSLHLIAQLEARHGHPDEDPEASILPTSLALQDLTAGERRDVGTLTLGRGLTQDVIVTEPSGKAIPATITAYPLARTTEANDRRRRVALRGDQAVGSRVRASTDGTGRAALAPFLPGPIWLDVGDHAWGVHPTREVALLRGRLVDLPSEPVRFELARSLLRFKIRQQGKPVAPATVLLHSPSQTLLAADQDGIVEVVVPSGIEVQLTAWSRAGSASAQSLTTPAASKEMERQIELDVGRPPPEQDLALSDLALGATRSLRLDVRSTTGASLPVHVEVRTATGRVVPTRWAESAGRTTWLSEGDLLGLGEVRCITPLPPGDYVLSIDAPGHLTATQVFSCAEGDHEPSVSVRIEPR